MNSFDSLASLASVASDEHVGLCVCMWEDCDLDRLDRLDRTWCDAFDHWSS